MKRGAFPPACYGAAPDVNSRVSLINPSFASRTPHPWRPTPRGLIVIKARLASSRGFGAVTRGAIAPELLRSRQLQRHSQTAQSSRYHGALQMRHDTATFNCGRRSILLGLNFLIVATFPGDALSGFSGIRQGTKSRSVHSSPRSRRSASISIPVSGMMSPRINTALSASPCGVRCGFHPLSRCRV